LVASDLDNHTGGEMVLAISDAQRGSAQLVQGKFRGTVVCWGTSPFWVGRDRGSLETAQQNPTLFPGEIRNGFYWVPPPGGGTPQPISIPWDGEVYVLNGKGPGDISPMAIFIELVPECAS
jgi:hypothetical protein